MIDLKRIVNISPGDSIPGNFHLTVRFDEGSQKQVHIATLLREVWNRLAKLEDANETNSNMPDNYFVIGHVEERLDKLEEKTKSVDDLLEGKIANVKVIFPKKFTQADIDDAVNAAIMAERDRACRIIRGFNSVIPGYVVGIGTKNILCEKIQDSA